MIDKIKSFFKNLASCWRYEEHLIKACNRATPLHQKVCGVFSFVLCFALLLFFVGAISASADEGVTSRAVPSNLTGYTVTVPAGWTCPEGYGTFDILGSIFGFTFSSFGIGLNEGEYEMSDYTEFRNGTLYRSFNPSDSLIFDITGGVDVSNPTLIQWFVNNNANFVNNNEPEAEPNPTVTFNKGLYKVSSTWYNSDISTQLDGMTFYSLSEGDLFTALTVQNDELIFDDENGDQHVMARNTTTGAKWIDNSGQFVYFINDESIPQSLAEQIPTLLEYIPDVSLTEYQRMQDSWYYGVQDGFTEGYNQASRDTEGTFLGNIFGGVFDALDKFQMFGQFSFLDFIKSIIGILALIWFLKLLAGG